MDLRFGENSPFGEWHSNSDASLFLSVRAHMCVCVSICISVGIMGSPPSPVNDGCTVQYQGLERNELAAKATMK